MPDLLPPNATKQERDISLALDRLPSVPIKTLWTPATCPEAHLPWLAWALSVDEWDAAWPVETKRSAIAGSIEQHRKKGTVGALKRALQRLGYEVEIDENTGIPYTFRLRFKVRDGQASGGAVLDQAIVAATKIALRQKNARSELIDSSLLAEAGTARLFAGAAPISGAEVEIKSPVTAVLPLDTYNVGFLGSFWTVKMRSAYNGPIARVKRDSDGALLTYYNLLQLRRFVGAGSFKFVRLFNQTGNGVATTTSTNMIGEFDANGLPRIKAGSYGDKFSFAFPNATFSGSSITCAFSHQGTDDSTGKAYAELNISQDTNYSFALDERKLGVSLEYISGFRSIRSIYSNGGYGGGNALNDESLLSGVGFIRHEPPFLHVHSDEQTANSSSPGLYADFNFKYFHITPGDSDDPIYGASFWNSDLGATAAEDIIEKIETHLDL